MLLARYEQWNDLVKQPDYKYGLANRKMLRKEQIHNQVLIPPASEGLGHEWAVIDFCHLYALPFDYVEWFASTQTSWLRLRSPYRQGVVHAFTRFLLRPDYLRELEPFDDWKSAPSAAPPQDPQ